MSNAKQIGFDIQTELKKRLDKIAEIESRHNAAPTIEDLRREISELAALCSLGKISHKAVANHLGVSKAVITNPMRTEYYASFEKLLSIRDGYLFLINQQFEGLQKTIEQ